MIRGVPSKDHRNFVNVAGPLFQNELILSKCKGYKVWEEGRFLFNHHKTLKDMEVKPDLMIREFHHDISVDLDKVQPKFITEYISDGYALDDMQKKFLLYEEMKINYFIMVYKRNFVVFEMNKKNFYKLKEDLEFLLHDDCKINFPNEILNLFNLKHIKTVAELKNWLNDLAIIEKIIRQKDKSSLTELYTHPSRR